jgi:hypothetical protein
VLGKPKNQFSDIREALGPSFREKRFPISTSSLIVHSPVLVFLPNPKTTAKSHQTKPQTMKTNLQTLAVAASIAASFLIGCASPPKITGRADPSRPSVVQIEEGYDTFGRKWDDETVAPPAKPQMLTRSDSVLLTYTGTITDIDYANREISLQGPDGRIETYGVDERVQRLNEAKVGDKVTADYYLGYNAEVRKPTPEEEQNPLVEQKSAGRAGPGAAPSAHSVRQVRAVVTIEGINRAAQTLTVKGPRGKYFVAKVADPSRLEQVHIGDTILMTFTEAAVISLKPARN